MPSYENTCILKRSETFIVQKSICLMDITQHNMKNILNVYKSSLYSLKSPNKVKTHWSDFRIWRLLDT